MAMVANDPKAAKRVGIPQSVGQEFMKADKGRKFGTGAPRSRPDLQRVNKPDAKQGKMEIFKEGGEMKESKAMMKKEVSFMKKKGAPKSMIKHEESEMKKMKTKRMMDGGMAGGMGGEMPPPPMPPRRPRPGMMPPQMPPPGMKKGGKVSMGKVKTAAPSRDGVAMKGKTKGKMITMRKGGRTC